MTAPTSPQTNPTRTVVDLAERRAARRRARRPTRYTFACAPLAAAPGESVLARLGQQLERQGLTPAEQLAHVVGLPDADWDRLWRDLARMTTTVATSLAADIRREHDAAQAKFASAVEHAVRCGELLAEAKAQVRHGGWLPWLAENFPASARTAQGYMRLAAQPNAQALAHWGIEGALRQLAAPVDPAVELDEGALLDERRLIDDALQRLEHADTRRELLDARIDALAVDDVEQRIDEAEARIDEAEADAITERWEFGRWMLGMRVGRKLPDGLLDQAVRQLDIPRTEIQNRMQFASRWPTRYEVDAAIVAFASWDAIVQRGLGQL